MAEDNWLAPLGAYLTERILDGGLDRETSDRIAVLAREALDNALSKIKAERDATLKAQMEALTSAAIKEVRANCQDVSHAALARIRLAAELPPEGESM